MWTNSDSGVREVIDTPCIQLFCVYFRMENRILCAKLLVSSVSLFRFHKAVPEWERIRNTEPI